MINLEYDKEADAAYISLINIGAGEVAFTYPCDPSEVKGMINLDFNKEGNLIGIEIISASKKLPKELLDQPNVKN